MADSKNHLKSVIEQSLSVLNQNEGAAREEISRRSSLPVYIHAGNREKVAVASASSALAALWNISAPSRPRRPPSKGFMQLKLTNGA